MPMRGLGGPRQIVVHEVEAGKLGGAVLAVAHGLLPLVIAFG
jgi:hypothetical protein